MTALDQTAPEQHHAVELSLAVQHALDTAATSGAEHALGWLSDHMSGVGGVSAPLLPDVLDDLRLEVDRLNRVMASAFDDLVNDRPSSAEQTLREALFIPSAVQAEPQAGESRG